MNILNTFGNVFSLTSAAALVNEGIKAFATNHLVAAGYVLAGAAVFVIYEALLPSSTPTPVAGAY